MINSDKIIKILEIMLNNLKEDKFDFLKKNAEEIIKLKQVALSLMDMNDKHRDEHKKIFQYAQELAVKIAENKLSDAAKLIKKMLQIELDFEKEEREEYLKFAKKCWSEFNEKFVLYHGTTSAYLENIKKYGLDFEKFQIKIKDLIEFNRLFKKMGEPEPITLVDSYSKKIIHLSPKREYSIIYAKQGGEINNLITTSYERAVARRSILKLNEKEKEELKRTYDLTTAIIRQGKPVLIQILAKCPDIINNKTSEKYMEEFSNFQDFEKRFNKIILGSINVQMFIDQMRDVCNSDAIAEKIGKEYIQQIEYI